MYFEQENTRHIRDDRHGEEWMEKEEEDDESEVPKRSRKE
jgi:hypothetical protein